ncbi:hypothetical protein HU763_014580 [Pseudomonas anuradhapurensis]|nr:hypothetical protein [Pseudomonas anuradhapurensis]QXI46004.1 hypothetical protein HU763_014580 [Pseudomonas anuradhapurensis]
MDQVAGFVVLVVGPGVFTQQVVHQLVAPRVAFQRAIQLLGLVVQQVAGRVEGKGLDARRLVACSKRPTGPNR